MPLRIVEPTDDLAHYRTLLTELTQANVDMEVGRFRIFKQETDSTEMLDVTPEAIRTNQISIVLLHAVIALKGLRDT